MRRMSVYNAFIERMSQIAGLDLGYFIRSGFWVSFRYGVVSLSGVALSVGFARLASKELIGQYQAILALLGIVSFASIPGLNMAAYRSIAKDGDDSVIIKAVKYSFYYSLIGIPVIAGYGYYTFFLRGDATMFYASLLGALAFPFFYAPNTWYVFYEAKSVFHPVSVRMIFLNVVSLLGLLAALIYGANLLILLGVYFLLNIVFNWFFFWEVARKIASKSEGLLDFRYGFSVTLQKFVFSFSENIPILTISSMFGFEALAVFQIAYFFINSVSGFLSGISTTYLPILFRAKQLNYSRIILQHIGIGLFLFILFKILFGIAFMRMYGTAYIDSFRLVTLTMYLIIVFPLKQFFLNFLLTRNRSIAIIISYAVANVCALAMLYMTRSAAVVESASWYLYVLNGVVMLFLGGYFFVSSRKIESI